MRRAFEFTIWQPIYHNDKFSHNTTRRVVREADSFLIAKDRVKLAKAKTTVVHEGLTIRTEKEYIKTVCEGIIETYTRFVPKEIDK